MFIVLFGVCHSHCFSGLVIVFVTVIVVLLPASLCQSLPVIGRKLSAAPFTDSMNFFLKHRQHHQRHQHHQNNYHHLI